MHNGERAVPLDHWLSKEPKQFVYFHRAMGYGMLSLITIVYHYTMADTKYQIYVPLLLLIVLLITPPFSRWLGYRFNNTMQRGVMFVIDIVITAIILAAVHLSIVLTFLTIFAMLYTAISNKISFLMVSLASLIGVVVFYISIIFVFGFSEYFEATSTELIVLGFLCLTTYFGVGSYYQRNQMQDIYRRKNHYFDQMNRYMEFANQLSRYAPVQLCQSIMKGESEAKI